MEQRVVMLSRQDLKTNDLKSDYIASTFTVRQDFAYVKDILILSTFDDVMWIGTTAQNISFLVTTPLTSIASSSFLNNEVSFKVEETAMYPLMNPDFIQFKKIEQYSSWGKPFGDIDPTKINFSNFSYSKCSINIEEKSITIWHNSNGTKDSNYSEQYDTEFLCGEA